MPLKKSYQQFFLYDIEKKEAVNEMLNDTTPHEMCDGGYCLAVVDKGV